MVYLEGFRAAPGRTGYVPACFRPAAGLVFSDPNHAHVPVLALSVKMTACAIA